MLVAEVLARNPTLPQMIAAWQAASARFPQVTALDDPMLGTTIGPASFGSADVNPAYRLEISQKFPFPGKLRLRGANALAQARAAGNDVEEIRLQLTEAAKIAYYDYFLVYRALAVNQESLRLLQEYRANAEKLYATGKVTQQDILQAMVEIGRTRERGLLLERLRQVVRARLNTLMNLQPDLPLPPPARELTVAEALPAAQQLRASALARRPDLQALANRIAAEEAALALARREYAPDFEPFFMYDKFMGNSWDMRALATQLGVKMNLPVRLGRRQAGIAEAQARLAQRQAELARLMNDINYEVQQAYEQVRESAQVVVLYEKEILAAARRNVNAAQAAYVAGKIPFLSLLEAERNVVNLQDRYFETVADYFRRLATLERVVGGKE